MRKLVRFEALFLSLCLSTAILSACGSKNAENPLPEGGIPDNTVSHVEQNPPSEPASEPPVTSPTLPEEEYLQSSAPETIAPSEETNTSQSTAATTQSSPVTSNEEDNVFIEELDDPEDVQDTTRAFDLLKLMNSSKVHVKLLEAQSYDNEQVSGIEREYFINGSDAVYINGKQKVVMSHDTVTVIDTDEMTYYTYSRDDESMLDNFGYGSSNYRLLSSETDGDGTVTERYKVSAHGEVMESTWTFYPSGKVTVSDVSPVFGSYYWYSIETVESNVSGMDMSIPEGLIYQEPEDYF